jgi:hypothetical protein
MSAIRTAFAPLTRNVTMLGLMITGVGALLILALAMFQPPASASNAATGARPCSTSASSLMPCCPPSVVPCHPAAVTPCHPSSVLPCHPLG